MIGSSDLIPRHPFSVKKLGFLIGFCLLIVNYVCLICDIVCCKVMLPDFIKWVLETHSNFHVFLSECPSVGEMSHDLYSLHVLFTVILDFSIFLLFLFLFFFFET